jgi:hypothetical protein
MNALSSGEPRIGVIVPVIEGLPHMAIRPVVSDDYEAILGLNAAWEHVASHLDRNSLAHLHASAAYHRVVEVSSRIVAFLLALAPGVDYGSPNYRWFNSRADQFLYIDRVIVDREYQRAGLGDALYDDLLVFARQHGVARLVCEIDIEPRNAPSDSFHTRRGFVEIGTQQLGDGKRVSLRELPVGSVEAMWAALTEVRPDLVDEQTVYAAWHFCDNQSDADALVELVLAGRKRATAGLLWSYEAEDEPLPRVGDLSVVTDWSGRARCVIRTTSVDIVPFQSVTPEFAAIEGEGDGSLEYWRTAHQAAFERELAKAGSALVPEAPVVCECFEVVFND